MKLKVSFNIFVAIKIAVCLKVGRISERNLFGGFLLGLLGQKDSLDVGQNTTSSNGDS